MSPLTTGVLYGAATLAVMFSGVPTAFALGIVAVAFMYFFMPAAALDIVAQNVYEEMGNIVILSIPLFILKGAAIGRTDAGRDIYRALHAWLQRIPGGLGIANTVACGLFAAISGSSPGTSLAIGSSGLPEMRRRGYSAGFAAGIIAAGGTLGILLPPSITMILYAVAAEVSLSKLFLAGIGPGLLLITLFSAYTVFRYGREHREAMAEAERSGVRSAILEWEAYTRADKLRMVAKVVPFVTLLTGVMIALYGGYATPSETAGLGAILALLIVAVMYGVYTWRRVYPILAVTLQESTMLMFIIGMSLLYAYVMSSLNISQSAAAWIVSLHLHKWVLVAAILLIVLALGFFLPPVSIILVTAPVILPPLREVGTDLIWFGVVMTIVMETGLIHPPVGLNVFVVRNIAPDIPLGDIIRGVRPFAALMIAAAILLCFVPGIAMWLPTVLSS